jgi:hypothetical protein
MFLLIDRQLVITLVNSWLLQSPDPSATVLSISFLVWNSHVDLESLPSLAQKLFPFECQDYYNWNTKERTRTSSSGSTILFGAVQLLDRSIVPIALVQCPRAMRRRRLHTLPRRWIGEAGSEIFKSCCWKSFCHDICRLLACGNKFHDP